MIKILTDSTADLPLEICNEYHIETIPMYIHLNGKNYQDGRDIDPEMIFEAVENTGVFPTTSAPSPADFINHFKMGDPGIYISVSGKLSATYNNAQFARKELPTASIDIIDSCSISTVYGQVVLQAAKWRNEGMGFEDLKYNIRKFVKRTRGVFILDTLNYLYKGGRCSAIQYYTASILTIRPLIEICTDGTLRVLKKIRGTRLHAVTDLLNYIKNDLNIYQIEKIIITHLNCEEEAAFLENQLRSINSSIEIEFARVGCVLAMHSGPKPIGIAYSVG